ncbi:MAG: N-acyl amino acid synthase FeeM domain-containing protein [Methylophagaceae bacterium]
MIKISNDKQEKNKKVSSLVRKRLNIDESLADEITFKIAQSHDELEQAYRLVHDVYEEEGYTDINPSGMRVNAFNAHPETVVFIAVKEGKVIMTLTLVTDSPFGLPMDDLYLKELSPFRRAHRHIGQLSSLASLAQYRCANQTLPLFLIKIMGRYARDHMRLDDLVITVNPKHGLFYESLLLFKKIGGLKACQEVKNHPAYAYLLELEYLPETYKRIYAGQPPEKNLHHFFYIKQHANIHLPEDNIPLYIWSNDKLNHFFSKKTNLFYQIDEVHLSYVLRRHASYWRTDTASMKMIQHA